MMNLRKQLHAARRRIDDLEEQLEEECVREWQLAGGDSIRVQHLSVSANSAPPVSADRVSSLQHLADIDPPMIRRFVRSLPSDLATVKITKGMFQ